MSTFDRNHGHIVVRVVYDGPSTAGKTENLKQLVRTFTSQRRGELSSPRQQDETTAYFDWLYLNGGVVGGHALRAQLLTVPGRSTLTRRRWQLVRSADVIVFVCESTSNGVREAKRSLELLRAHLEASGLNPPIIVQANKQDLPDALPEVEVARALGLEQDAELVAASAAVGNGVRETIVRAIRAAASLAEREILARGVEGMPYTQDEADLLAQLDGSAQMRAALELGSGSDADEEPLPSFPDEDVASSCLWPSTSGRKVLRALARALVTGRVTRLRSEARSIRLRVGDLVMTTALARCTNDPGAARAALFELARAYVRAGSFVPPETTLVLAAGSNGATDGSAPSAPVEDRPSPDSGPIWLWTISPWTMSLRERLEAAELAGDEAALTTALRAYANGLVEALLFGSRDQVGIDLDPSNFGELGGRVVYLGDLLAPSPSRSSIVELIPEVSRRWARRANAAHEYVTALGEAMADRGPLSEGIRVSLARALEGVPEMARSARSAGLI